MSNFVSSRAQMDRLTAMQVFTEVAQRGSFTAAADHLEMSRVMVTRYVNSLESWMGARLLQRSTRRIALTEAGSVCLAQCRKMIELSQEMQDLSGLPDKPPKGLLRVTTTMSFGITHLAAAVTDYLAKYPEVSVDMQMVDRSVNLIEDRVDLAVRISGELDPSLVARRIAPCRSVVCASPRYLEGRAAPKSPADLALHNCLTYSNFGKGAWRFQRGRTQADVAVGGNLSANEVTFLTQATLAGAGIALQPSYVAGPLIRAGHLVRLLPEWRPPELSIWGVYLSRRHVPASLRTMLDFLVARFAGEPDWDSY